MARGARSTPLKQGPGGRLASGRSKTGDPACSQAMSMWVRARHGGAVAAEVFKILAGCRAKARAQGMARSHAIAGNEAKSQVWARRAERGLSGAARGRLAAEKRAARTGPGRPFHEQVTEAASRVPHSGRFGGNKAFISHVHAAHQADRTNPRMTLGRFKAGILEHREKLPLSRADMVQAMRPEDVERSSVRLHLTDRERPAAEWHFIRTHEGYGREDYRGGAATATGRGTPERAALARERRVGLEARRRMRAERHAAGARKAAEAPAPKEGGFSLKQESAIGKKAFRTEDTGRGRTGTLFDMKKGDLPGQTSLLERVGSRESNPRAARYSRMGAPSEVHGELARLRAGRATEIRSSRREAAAKAETDRRRMAREATPGPAPAYRPHPSGRGTAERSAKARSLADLRRQRNAVRADLKHYTAEHAARNPHDQSRADRLDELAAVNRQIGRTRGAKVQTAKLSPKAKGVGKVSPEFELARAKARLATRARTAGKLKALKGHKDEHTHPEIHGKPDTPYRMGTEHIHFDPDRFQYKLGGQGAHGVTDALADVTEWNPTAAGIVSVWRDPANGRTYVVNGHHRVDLAKRLGVGKVKVQYLDSPDAAHARAEGAVMNIAEGRGTALDAAKFFRDRGMTIEGARAHGVSLKEHTARQGLAMSHLSTPIFRRVVDGELSTNRAAIIGAAGLSHDEQSDLMRTLDKGKYRNITDGTVRNLADTFHRAGAVKVKERGLFGDDEHAESLGVHRATLEDKIKRKLTEDTKLFGLVSKSKSAQALAERADSNIDTEKAGEVAQEARTLHHFFDRLKQYGGLSRSLNEGAEHLHSGRKMSEVFSERYKKAREHIKAELEAGGLG